jgi:hypothetical protein
MSNAVTVALILVSLALGANALSGSSNVCHMGKSYNVNHDIVLASNTTLVDLDSYSSIRAMSCNNELSDILLTFSSSTEAAAFVDAVYLSDPHHTFVTSQFARCQHHSSTAHRVRRVVSAIVTDASVEVRAVPSTYSELIQEGTVSMASAGSCESDQHFCVGYNADAQCSGAEKIMPLYSNKFVELTCSSCYAAFQGDVFLTLDIKRFKLQSISAGFKNLVADVSLILDLKGSAQWGAGYDKVFPVIPSATGISFSIGKIPFHVSFEMPLEVKVSASFAASAAATAGVASKLSIGDMYASWSSSSGWSHVTPHPQMSWSPMLQTQQPDFSGDFSVSLIPTVTMKLNDVFSYSLSANPNADLKVGHDASAMSVCANSTVSVDLHAHSEIHFDIDWLHVHDDKTWDKDVYASGTLPLEQKCLHL